MSGFIGLETFFSSLQIESEADVIVAAVHWALILDGFRCVGPVNKANVTPSEFLPEGWNQNQELYTLKYIKGNEKEPVFTLKIIKSEDTLVVNFLNSTDTSAKALTINIKSHVNEDISSFGAYKDPKALYDIVSNLTRQTDLVRTTSQTEQARDWQSDELGPSGTLPNYYIDPLGGPRRDFDDDPLSVGRGDLDPIGRNRAEGMFMDPSRLFRPFAPQGPRYGLPRGAIPPGARFDPFGPPGFSHPRPDRMRFAVPDPDHLPPPGYNDMFG